jgi:AcrR family transcriptional regulator
MPFGEMSTNHIAKKTGISIGTLYKYYPNKDAILADLSLMYMQRDAELFRRIFEDSSRKRQRNRVLVSNLVEALVSVHREDAQVRGVIYQNLERLKLIGAAQSATRSIQTNGTASVPELDPILTWVAISAIDAAVHSTSQLSKEFQQRGLRESPGADHSWQPAEFSRLGGTSEAGETMIRTQEGPMGALSLLWVSKEAQPNA